jgi:hypothetical protein
MGRQIEDDSLLNTLRRAEWCRLKAGECEALAATVADRDAKMQMRDLARRWLLLADQAEWLDQCAPGWDLDSRQLH